MLIAVIPLLVAVAGVLCYALSSNGKVQEIGRILFWTSWLALMLQLGSKTLRLG